jgi:hypothetical protein
VIASMPMRWNGSRRRQASREHADPLHAVVEPDTNHRRGRLGKWLVLAYEIVTLHVTETLINLLTNN